MRRPPEGICTRVQWVRNRDGDTVVVRLKTGQECAIRLMGIDCPELGTRRGDQAARFLNELLAGEDGQELLLWIPPIRDVNGDGVLSIPEILQQTTFDRVPGRLFIGTEDVTDILERHGYAAH